MSLRIWLPLTKDLRNQGLDDVTVTNNGATFNASGKLGGCYQFGNGSASSNGLFLNSNLVDLMQEEYSVAVWVKPLGNHYHYNGVIFSSGNWNGTCYSFGLSQNNSQVDILCKGYNNYMTCAVPINTWTHLICTCDSNNIVRLYKNGEYINSSAKSNKPDSDNLNQAAIGRETYANGYFTFNGMLNDFRLYDHCLSPFEIKQISQGLILHYPLNHGGLGQENLLKNSNFLQGTNGMEGYTTISATCTKQTNCMKVVSTSASGGFYTSNFNNIATGDMTTFSADVKANSNMTIYIGTDGSGNSSCRAYTVGTSWQRISISKAKTTNNANLRIYGNGTFYVKNLKYELGSIATPWCPNFSDILATTMGLNDTIEYDCSGYGNNGTRIGTFNWTSDTPRYSVSTHIGTTSSKIHISDFPTSGFGDSYSFAWWGKRNSNSPMFWGFSNGIRLNGMYLGTLWNTGDGSNNPIYKPNTTTTITAPSLNVWHHYVMTGDGKTCKLYIDGEFYGQAKVYKAISGTSIYINGYDASTLYCSNNTDISDFRIYATALSPEDVLNLYNLGAAIDTNNNLYGAMLEEG